ncbi:hypothetical protein AVEN_40204-1 [Araneus ventricosus]|uniref:Uncharacterized protein n=1 Tax=Araneus ventricosus TaxID=182803 RepID=A0A4Y2WN63_ARAVE|nr:hypothetical protein AVEN_78965-1 [Araneus ventricosus]GBO39297.1 hypothetical protein AVEN_40204-1 [Araneus ventricosus]
MTTLSEKEMGRIHELPTDDETDEDSDFDKEQNRTEGVLEEIFSDLESFNEHDTESENDGDFGNEEVNNSEWFPSEDGVLWRKTKFRQNIHTECLNIVLRLHGIKGPAKYVARAVKCGELFIIDNMIKLIVKYKKHIHREMHTELFT